MAATLTSSMRLAGAPRRGLAASLLRVCVVLLIGFVMGFGSPLNPAVHAILDADAPAAAAQADAGRSSHHASPVEMHDNGGAHGGAACSGHCGLHAFGMPAPAETIAAKPPSRARWPLPQARQAAVWRPFSLDRPPRA